MMGQIAVNTAIAIFEGVNEYEAEGNNGSGYNRVYITLGQLFCCFGQAVHQLF